MESHASAGGSDRPTTTSHEEAKGLLDVARSIGYACILWGDVGIGKSTLVERYGKDTDTTVLTVIASQSDPTDFGGMPVQTASSVVTADGGSQEVPTVDYALPDWAAIAIESKSAIIFLDEFTNASPAVQAAALEVVLNRKIGRVKLPDSVQFIAAANPPEIAANGFELSPPTANRFMHVYLRNPSAEEWTTALLDGWGVGSLPASEVDSATKVAAFVMSRPNLLHDRPDTASAAGGAWPSPRTWAHVVKGLAQINGLVNLEAKLIVESLIGPFAAREFMHWLAHVDLPSPAAVLADPAAAKLTAARPDRSYAVLLSVVMYVNQSIKEHPERWTQALSFLAEAADTVPDIAAHAARSLPRRPPAAEIPRNVEKFLSVLIDAGMAAA